MSEVIEPSDHGLFLRSPDPRSSYSSMGELKPILMRISAITVYSAPQTSRRRVVAYQVTQWLNDPVGVPMQSEGVLVSRGDSENEFYFYLDPIDISLPSLIHSCIHHYLSKVAVNRDRPFLIDPVERLFSRQKDGFSFDIYGVDDKTPVCNIVSLQHHETYACDESGRLEEVEKVGVYTLSDGTTGKVPGDYDHWEKNTYDYLCAPDTFTSRRIRTPNM